MTRTVNGKDVGMTNLMLRFDKKWSDVATTPNVSHWDVSIPRPRRRSPDKEPGFNVLVSNKPEFSAQIQDALAFVAANRAALKKIGQSFSAFGELDFGLDTQASSYCGNYLFEASLLRELADLSIDLNFTVYG